MDKLTLIIQQFDSLKSVNTKFVLCRRINFKARPSKPDRFIEAEVLPMNKIPSKSAEFAE